MAQAARTLRNARRRFVQLHPDWYLGWAKSDAEFTEQYVTKFVEFLQDEAWKPEGNREAWGRNVMAAYRIIKAKDVFKKPPSVVVK